MRHKPAPSTAGIAVAGALALAVAGSASAATSYSEDWSAGDTNGWLANTIDSTVVRDGGSGNPAGSIATRRITRANGFDIGALTGDPAATGSFSGTPWVATFDVYYDIGKFTDGWLRFRFQDSTQNGWRYDLGSSFVNGQWTTYSVSFDPSWDNATANANGWFFEGGPGTTWSGTMANVFRTEIRLANDDPTQSALARIDNFNLRPVPEPSTWALMGVGLAVVGWMGTRRPARARAS